MPEACFAPRCAARGSPALQAKPEMRGKGTSNATHAVRYASVLPYLRPPPLQEIVPDRTRTAPGRLFAERIHTKKSLSFPTATRNCGHPSPLCVVARAATSTAARLNKILGSPTPLPDPSRPRKDTHFFTALHTCQRVPARPFLNIGRIAAITLRLRKNATYKLHFPDSLSNFALG